MICIYDFTSTADSSFCSSCLPLRFLCDGQGQCPCHPAEMGSTAKVVHLLVLLLGLCTASTAISVFSDPFSSKLGYLLTSCNTSFFFSHVFWKIWTKGMIGNTLGFSIAEEKVMHSSCYVPFPMKIKSLT